MRPSRLLLFISILLVVVTCVAALAGFEIAGALTGLWIALAVAAGADLLLSPAGRSVQMDLSAPATPYVGSTAYLTGGLNARSGTLPQHLGLAFGVDGELEVKGLSLQPDAQHHDFDAPFVVKRRGKSKLHTAWLRWPSRFGLFEIISRKTFDIAIDGVPNIQPVLSGEITTQVQAELYGVKTTAAHGEGSDFHQLRDYVTGMDPRLIDWKRSARHQHLVARETHVEQNHQIIMCVDNGYLMREEIDGLPKIDRAINAALATTWAAGIGGDLVGFYSFDSTPKSYLPPQPGRQAFNRIRAEAAALEYSSVESNHTLALAHLNGQLNRRSLIIVFSDFVDTITAELMVENLAVLSRQHVMIFVALRDPALDRIAHPDDASLDNIARAVSAQQIIVERQLVLDQLRRMGVVCLDIPPQSLTPELVSAYIDIKAREMI